MTAIYALNIFELKERCKMVNVTVLIDYMGKNYQTNVIAKRGTAEEEIQQMAYEQVRKQWASK